MTTTTASCPPDGPLGERLRNAGWRHVERHDRLGSTNAHAVALAQPWGVVIADEQTGGRGRLDRSWEAPAGSSVLVSATLPAPRDTTAVGWVPLIAGLAVRDVIAQVAGLDASLKWPNDVLLAADADRKVSGVLCEWVAAPHTAADPGEALVVVGIGLNLTQGRADLPVNTATSIALAGGPALHADDILPALLAALQDRYADLTAGEARAGGQHAAYRAACATLGRSVRLTHAGRERHGQAEGIADDGSLLLRTAEGIQRITAGDVEHVRASGLG